MYVYGIRFKLFFSRFYRGMDPPGPIFFATEFSTPKISEELSQIVLEHADLSLKNSKGQTILFEAQLRNPDYAADILKKYGVNIAERWVCCSSFT